MRISPYFIGSFLAIPAVCYAAEVLPAGNLQIEESKRASSRLSDERCSKRPRPTKNQENGDVISLDAMKDRLERKAIILTRDLPKAYASLLTIDEELAKRIVDLRSKDIRRAASVGVILSGVRFVSNSTNTMLSKLKERDYENMESLVNVSMSIIGSGALKVQLDKIIQSLSESEETQDINTDSLNETIQSIQSITQDIENPIMSYSLI
jgi:hypothetical protein